MSHPPAPAVRTAFRRLRRARTVWAVRRLWFLHFQRHRHRRLVLEQVLGRPLLILPDVLNPVLFGTGELLARAADSLPLTPASTVLDLGTGSGVCAVVAAHRAGRVVAVDLNPEAVRCARINALLNGVDDRIDARCGDLFAPVRGRRFDVVLFNPPYLPGIPHDDFDRALRGGDVAERFAAGLSAALSREGLALLLLSSDGEPDRFLRALEAHGLSRRRLIEHDLWNERVTIHEVRAGRDEARTEPLGSRA